MNGSGSTPSATRRRLRLIALTVAVIGVLALAAAAFVLSYPGARDTVLTTGVSKNLARIYPGIFDAVLVVACAAALTLRGIVRAYAWLAILVITAAIAAADATHAMSVTLPKRPMEATVAAVPWAVLLIGFTLLYAMARQKRPPKTLAPPTPGNGIHPTSKTVPLSELLKTKPTQGRPIPMPPPPKPAKPAAETPPGKQGRSKKARRRATPAPPHPQTADTAPAETRTPEASPAPAPPADTPSPEPLTPASATQPQATDGTPTVTQTETPVSAPAKTAESPATETPTTHTETVTTAPTQATGSKPTPADAAQTEAAGGTRIVASVGTSTDVPTTPAETRTEAAGSAAAQADGSMPAETLPSEAPLAELPPLPRRRSIQRDEPSDADAESPEPVVLFNRLRSSPTPPGDDD